MSPAVDRKDRPTSYVAFVSIQRRVCTSCIIALVALLQSVNFRGGFKQGIWY